VRLWDVDTGEVVVSVDHGAPAPDRRWVKAVAFSPDGRALFTGGADHVLRRWDLDGSLEAPTAEVRGPNEPVMAALSPDGATLAVTWLDGSVLAHDASTLEARGPLALLGGPPHAETIDWEPSEGRRCLLTITALGRPTGSRWLLTDATTGQALREVRVEDVVAERSLPAPAPRDRGWNLAHGCFAGDDRALVAVRNRTAVLVYDLRRDDARPAVLEVPPEVARYEEGLTYRGIAALAVHDDLLVAGTHGGLLLGFSLRDGALRWWAQAHEQQTLALTLTEDGRRIVTAGGEGALAFWDLRPE
jgi:WD40 repeat protein